MKEELEKFIKEKIEETRDARNGSYGDTIRYDQKINRLEQLKNDLFGY